MAETKVVVEETKPKTLKDYLQELPGHPTDVEIEAWKAQFGEIFMAGFSETEIYVFRSLRRSEHKTLQMKLAGEKPIDELVYQEMVCDVCKLWPKETDWEVKGGLASSLSEQIYQNSHFLSPQAASLLVVKL